MQRVVLRSHAADGEPLTVTFLPLAGMNMISYRKGACEIIDQTTLPLFESRRAGLGALIGPHFYHRPPQEIPPVADEALFPHIAALKAHGDTEWFSHGIGRYVPWRFESGPDTIDAALSGRDLYQGTPLAALEGFDFTMTYSAKLAGDGLKIELRVEADHPAVMGLHTYYALEHATGIVQGLVQPQYNDGGVFKPMPPSWLKGRRNQLSFDLAQEADYGFLPEEKGRSGPIRLSTETHGVRIEYASPSENSWQLYHPKGASFACIEPLTANNPRGLAPRSGALNIVIAIETKERADPLS